MLLPNQIYVGMLIIKNLQTCQDLDVGRSIVTMLLAVLQKRLNPTTHEINECKCPVKAYTDIFSKS